MRLNLKKEHLQSAREINFLYQITFVIIELSKFLNVIELIKFPIYRITLFLTESKVSATKNCNTFIAWFIIIKWIFVILAIYFAWAQGAIEIVVWYLIFNNLHTYFLNHLWEARFNFPIQVFRRRFLNLIQAIVFSNVAFAYLYTFQYSTNFKRICGFEYNEFWTELKFSFANSISNTNHNYFDLNKLDHFVGNVTVTQLILTFVFISILLATSLNPPNQSDTREQKESLEEE